MSPLNGEGTVPISVRILREHGPLDLREITRKTARAARWSLMYADVNAVLRGAAKRGEVRIVVDAVDYRDRVWEANMPAKDECPHAYKGWLKPVDDEAIVGWYCEDCHAEHFFEGSAAAELQVGELRAGLDERDAEQ